MTWPEAFTAVSFLALIVIAYCVLLYQMNKERSKSDD